MAFNIIPQLGAPGKSFLEGIDTGSTLFSRLMQPKLKREELMQQQKQFEAQQAQKVQQFQASLALQKMAQARAAQASSDAHKIALMKLDPNAEVNSIRNLIAAFGGMDSNKNVTPTQEQSYIAPISDANSSTDIKDIPQINERAINPYDAQQQNQRAESTGGLDLDSLRKSPLFPIINGVLKKRHGIDLSEAREEPYQGPAREAHDIQRLADKFGENSREVKEARARAAIQEANAKSLGDIRGRTIAGLRPGDTPIYNNETGVLEGYNKQLSQKERDREIGRGFFNELYPIVYKGASPFSGQGSIRKLESVASRYNSDPSARQLFDDFLLAEKLTTAATVNEAATLGSGHTNQTYKQLRESLNSSDIPSKIKSLIRQFQIPASAELKASKRFQDAINAGQLKASQGVPATKSYYFNPESHKQAPDGTEKPDIEAIRAELQRRKALREKS